MLENVDALKEKWRLERRYCRSEINSFISSCNRPFIKIHYSHIIIHSLFTYIMIGRGRGRRRYTSCSPSLPWSPLPLALSASGLAFLFYKSGQKNLDGDVSRSCFLHCHRCPSRPQKHRLSRFRKVVVHCSLLPQGIKYMGSLILTPNGYIWTHTLLRSG